MIQIAISKPIGLFVYVLEKLLLMICIRQIKLFLISVVILKIPEGTWYKEKGIARVMKVHSKSICYYFI